LPQEELAVDSSSVDNARVDKPLGEAGRFGPAGDLAR
jgi:hypothetical protein